MYAFFHLRACSYSSRAFLRPAEKSFRQIALPAAFPIRPSFCASLVHSLKIPSNGGMRSSAWVTPPCPRLLKTFKICAQKKDLRSILPFDYTIDRSLSSRHFYTVYSYLPVSRFHARMKICLREDTKEAPFYEQKERWRSQRGKHRRCVFANGAVNCFVTSRDATGRFHARMKICLQEGTKEAPLYEQKERWHSQRGKHRRCDS